MTSLRTTDSEAQHSTFDEPTLPGDNRPSHSSDRPPSEPEAELSWTAGPQPSVREIEEILDDIALLCQDLPSLPDHALTRASIYDPSV